MTYNLQGVPISDPVKTRRVKLDPIRFSLTSLDSLLNFKRKETYRAATSGDNTLLSIISKILIQIDLKKKRKMPIKSVKIQIKKNNTLRFFLVFQ